MCGVEAVGEREDMYESVGSREDLDRFLAEYHLSEDHIRDRIQVRNPPPTPAGDVSRPEYHIHESLLRAHGEFPCAGDSEALAFCCEIAEEMVRVHGISRSEAVARVNRQWSEPDDPSGRVPRCWIVGADLVYHDEAANWATGIYFGFEGRWWSADADLQPLPPPLTTANSRSPSAAAVQRRDIRSSARPGAGLIRLG